MHRVRQQDLPFRGSAHHFVGADQGDVNVCAFLLNALPGKGPGPHRHPYDEVQFIREGRGLYNVNGEEFEAGPGDILVIKAGSLLFGQPPDQLYLPGVVDRVAGDAEYEVEGFDVRGGRAKSPSPEIRHRRRQRFLLRLDDAEHVGPR